MTLAVGHSWPLASDPIHLTRLDNDDAALNTWVIAWVAHILPRDPLQLFAAPMFHPEPLALAYSEHLLVPSLLGAPLLWLGLSPVLVHNLLIIAGLALSGWVMYLVMFRWTADVGASVIGGLLYAFNAHTLTRFVHVQAFHVWLYPAMLYAFDRILSGGTRRHVVLLVVAYAGQALSSNYLLAFSTISLIAIAVARVNEWLPADRLAIRKQLAVAAAASALVLAPFLYPYYLLSQTAALPSHSHSEITHYSATWRDYLATGGRLHFEWWSRRFFTDIALFPGITALALAGYGVVSIGLHDRRIRMLVAIVVVGVALSFGAHLPGYWLLHQHVPLLGALRNVGRWGFLALAGLSMLAAAGASRLVPRARQVAAKGAIGAMGLAIAVLVTVEAWRAPVGFTEFAGIPRLYDRLAGDEHVVLAEFPFYAGQAWSQNGRYLLNNTRYFKPLINGYSSYWPRPWPARAQVLETFPSPAAVDLLRTLGATHLTVHVQAFARRHGEAALAAVDDVPGLTLVAEDDGIRLYRLTPSTRDRPTSGPPITRSGSSK